MSTNQNNAKIVSTCNQRITALSKLVKAKTTMKINGEPLKLSEVVAVYQACIDTRAELVAQRAAFDKALRARDDAEVTRLAIDKGLKAWLTSELGPDSQEAREIGFLPPKIGVKSAATKALAVEKLHATRKARGTRGKRQRENIKGTIVAPGEPAPPADTTHAGAPPADVTASTKGAPTGASPSNGAAATL